MEEADIIVGRFAKIKSYGPIPTICKLYLDVLVYIYIYISL